MINHENMVSITAGYHIYKSVQTPTLQEQVYGEIEPHNPVYKYVVAVKKDEKVVGHLPLREDGKLQKQFFTFFVLIPMGDVT